MQDLPSVYSVDLLAFDDKNNDKHGVHAMKGSYKMYNILCQLQSIA